MSYGSFLGEWIVPQNVDVGFVVDTVGNNEVVDTVDHYYYDTMHRDRMCTPLEAQNDVVAVAKKRSIALVATKLDLAMHLEMVVMN